MRQFFALLLFYKAFALPTFNPADSSLYCESTLECIELPGGDCLNLRLGFVGNYVFQRNLEIDHSVVHAGIHSSRIITNAGYFALNFFERADFYGFLGTSSLVLEDYRAFLTAIQAFFQPDLLTLSTDTAFSYCLGGRVTLLGWHRFLVGVSGGYFYTKPSVNTVNIDGFPVNYPQDFSWKYQEWQALLGATYSIQTSENFSVLPYAALNFSGVSVKSGEKVFVFNTGFTQTFFDLQASRLVGYSLGLTCVGNDAFSFGVEGRFANELAFSLNAQFQL